LFSYRHEGPSDIGALPEEAFDIESKRNVLRWVSAHMIPVRNLTLICKDLQLNYFQCKSYPISFNSQRYDTLLPGKSVQFTVVGKSEPNEPEWKRVEIDNRLHVIDSKEVCLPHWMGYLMKLIRGCSLGL
jgi:hypothetical protein